jgi:hypothetical protein
VSIISWPTSLSTAAEFTIGQQRYDVTESSDSTGADAARLLGPPRWTVGLRSVEALNLTQAGAWEAMLLSLRGRVNHLALHDPVRAVPNGTLRGSPTLNASASAGATSIVLTGVRPTNNLLTQTRAFDASGWTAINGGTVTANTATDPFGNVSADTLTDGNAGASAGRRQTVTVPNDSASYCYSLYVKKTSGGTSHTLQAQLQFQGGSATSKVGRINTDLGTVLAGTGITVTDVDANWWRMSFAHTNDSSGNTTLRFDIFPAVNTYGGTTADPADTGSAIVACAQLEIGTTASAYAPPTLLAGDWLQIGTGVGTSQLVKVTADAVAAIDGTMTVSFEPPLRTAFASSTAVTWDKPVAYYKQTSSPQWGYRARMSTGYALDLLESWTA